MARPVPCRPQSTRAPSLGDPGLRRVAFPNAGSRTRTFTELLFSEPMPDQFARFAEAMGCDPESVRMQTSTDVVTTTYSGCDDDVPLVFYEVVGGGHAWPSSPLTEPDSPMVELLTALQGYTTFDIDAAADSWAFFEQHSRDA